MLAQIIALVGLLVVIGSMFTNAIVGTQVALIGIALLLIALISEVRKLKP